jgi:hypothetical protein
MNHKPEQFCDISPVSRRAATIANLIHQYVTTGLVIVNGIVLVPLYLKYIDFKLYGAWLATGNVAAWLLLADAGFSDILRQRTAHLYGQPTEQELKRSKRNLPFKKGDTVP